MIVFATHKAEKKAGQNCARKEAFLGRDLLCSKPAFIGLETSFFKGWKDICDYKTPQKRLTSKKYSIPSFIGTLLKGIPL